MLIKTELTDISSSSLYFSQAFNSVSRLSVAAVVMIILCFIFLVPSLVSVAMVILLWITYRQAKQVKTRKDEEEEVEEEDDEDQFSEEEYSSGSSDLLARYSSIPDVYVERERKESSNSSSSSCYRRLRTDSQQAIEKVLTLMVNPLETQERTASFDHAMEEFSGRVRRRTSLFQEDRGPFISPLLDKGRLLKRRQSHAVLLRSSICEKSVL